MQNQLVTSDSAIAQSKVWSQLIAETKLWTEQAISES